MIDVATFVRDLYDRFNARDIDGVFAKLGRDVVWANGMDGGYEYGKEAIRTYWRRQWAAIDPHVQPLAITTLKTGSVVVDVRQIVKNFEGDVLFDELVTHTFTIADELVTRFDIGKTQSLLTADEDEE